MLHENRLLLVQQAYAKIKMNYEPFYQEKISNTKSGTCEPQSQGFCVLQSI